MKTFDFKHAKGHARAFRSALGLGLAAVLCACSSGGDRLDTTNAETFQATYASLIADMAEADRRRLGTSVMMAANTDGKAPEDIRLDSWGFAQARASDLSAMTTIDDPMVRGFASELSLKTTRLNGMTAEQILAEGEAMRDQAAKGTIGEYERNIDTLKAAKGQLEAGRRAHIEARDAALAKIRAVAEENKAYKAAGVVTAIDTASNPPKATVELTMTAPDGSSLRVGSMDLLVSVEDYSAYYSFFLAPLSGFDKKSTRTASSNLNLSPNGFASDAGRTMRADFAFPSAPGAYTVEAFPTQIQTGGGLNLRHKPDADTQNAVSQVGSLMRGCDNAEARIDQLVEQLEERVQSVRGGDFSKPGFFSISYQDKC